MVLPELPMYSKLLPDTCMKISDIVNRDIVNLENCDQEPIHIPGSIQPHGFLLGLSKTSYEIRFCSNNTAAMTETEPKDLLEKPFGSIFGDDALAHLKKSLHGLQEGRTATFMLNIHGNPFHVLVHESGDTIILDAEQHHPNDQPDFLQLSSEFVNYIEETSTIPELCTVVAEGTKKITGYDRVMIYRFDEQYNGEVIAESKNDDLEGFLGLHYPHTDIPKQARELYIKNQLRMIVDVNYTPVPVVTMNEQLDHSSLDLSYSILRSVSPIHVEYLNNMGVGATLTISLLHKKKLWGLISCHHYSPKHLTYEVRMATKLLGHFITSQIDTRQLNEEYEIARKATHAVEWLNSRRFELNRNSMELIVNDYHILTVCNAAGVSVLLDGKIFHSGSVPPNEDIHMLSNYLATYTSNTRFQTDSLIHVCPEFKQVCEKFPGVNYFPLDSSSFNCIIWYRHETISEITWAGNPNKAIEKDKNGLSPRKSFELWKETVKFKSNKWLASEVAACSNFVNILQKHLSSVFLTEEEEKQRQLAEILKRTNAELENINWISTHDLQEPLRKIQMMASYILQDDAVSLPSEIYTKIEKMNQFASRMQGLIKDILRYSQLNYGQESFEQTDLSALLQQVENDLQESFEEKSAKLVLNELPTVYGVPFLIKQLFSNLIYNSLKFSSNNRKPTITIESSSSTEHLPEGVSPENHFIIDYTDNGIGFDAAYNENVFKIFTKLQSSDQFPGSGIGLALCKKIIMTHKGSITAHGIEGEGVLFKICFPR